MARTTTTGTPLAADWKSATLNAGWKPAARNAGKHARVSVSRRDACGPLCGRDVRAPCYKTSALPVTRRPRSLEVHSKCVSNLLEHFCRGAHGVRGGRVPEEPENHREPAQTSRLRMYIFDQAPEHPLRHHM